LAAQWALPANTIALNPYARPPSAARPGEIPKGAQLLSKVEQTPGGGRDLYASPDGEIYRRQNDGWYRRQAGGNWQLYAPAQGTIQRAQASPARGAQTSTPYVTYRPLPGAGPAGTRSQALANRVPDSGVEARAQDVAALERQYYARSLAEARTQNWRGSANISRGGGRAGRRR
jgi:hypothetical protein